jgi:predicted permease
MLGPLPLLFVDALFKAHPDPTLRPRAVALISFYLLAWSPLFWNYGYSLLVPERRSAQQTLLLSKKDGGGSHGTTASAAGGRDKSGGGGGGPMRRLRRLVSSRAIRQVLNPPTLGCTMGAIAGLVPPVRRCALRLVCVNVKIL